MLQILIRLSLFNSISISDLTQIDNLEVNNHKISSILHQIKMMINKSKILTIIETVTEIMIKIEIKKKTETEIISMIMKIKVKVKIMIEDSDSIIIFV